MEFFILITMQFVHHYLNCKVLSKKYDFEFSEIVLVLLLGCLSGSIYFKIGVYVSMFTIIAIYWLNYRIHQKVFYSVGLVSYATIIIVLVDHLATIIQANILKQGNEGSNFWYLVVHLFLTYTISLLISYFLSISITKIEKKTSMDIIGNPLVVGLGFTTMVVYYASVYLGVGLGNSISLIQLNLLFFLGYLIATLVIFFFYINSLRNKYEIKQKEIEYESTQRYLESFENQYNEIRKFRHDYKNILSSLDDFILEEDYVGLKNYYLSKIKPSSDNISENDYRLNNLSNLKVRELKSIVAFKLISAQELGFDTTVEVQEPIQKIPMDSIFLVRIMGILLDNAIEELQEVGSGSLSVAFFQDSKAVQIIISNTCREEIPKIHQLKKEGFSTKGSNRGLGLSNMNELIGKCNNVLSETIVENQHFIQRLVFNK